MNRFGIHIRDFYVSCPVYFPRIEKCAVRYMDNYPIAESNGCDDFNNSSKCQRCLEACSKFFMDHPDLVIENTASNPFHFE